MTQEERNAIERFPTLAREFCQFIDDCAAYDRQRFVQCLSVHLARLCEVAASLPWVEPATEGTDHTQEEVSAHTREWERLEKLLRNKLDALDEYWDVFDPTEREQPIQGSLASDIAEIYLDLKEALSQLTDGTPPADMYFDWRLEFRTHWSRHAARALKVCLQISDIA